MYISLIHLSSGTLLNIEEFRIKGVRIRGRDVLDAPPTRLDNLQWIPILFAHNDFPTLLELFLQFFLQDRSQVRSFRVGVMAEDHGFTGLSECEDFVLRAKRSGEKL